MLFPEPDAPVTHTSVCKGKETFTDFKLFSLAPMTFISLPGPFSLVLAGVSIFLFDD